MKLVWAVLAFSAAQLAATEAFAYIGPGAGISAIGSLVAVLATLVLVIVGFVWYPVKRLRQRMRRGAARPVEAAEQEADGK